ncbi:MAG: hypothetical protein CMJ86_10425 [Planctomycetes bacterium]|nr:hypothetical protein [Planctomycetota bacterium]
MQGSGVSPHFRQALWRAPGGVHQTKTKGTVTDQFEVPQGAASTNGGPDAGSSGGNSQSTSQALADSCSLDGQSAVIKAFRERLEKLAKTRTTVLIVGEPGSGKSRAARALHLASQCAGGPLVVVQPAALSPGLLEAELFGHEAGAFTGAGEARLGRFRLAQGGTLVLDGVEDLPAPLQTKLLRVLQEKVVEPLGTDTPLPIDVRIVATSRRPLQEEVEAGRFREDLFYRLAVVELVVPPLRDRIEDLRELVPALIKDAAARAGLKPRPVSEEAFDLLARHSWPGNLAELENALERALALAGSDSEVQREALEYLLEEVHGAADQIAESVLAAGVSLEELTDALLLAAMRATRGNASAAARRLGLSRRTFGYRLRRGEQRQAGQEAEEEEDPQA